VGETDLGSPSCLLGDPADLCLADSAHDPVAAIFLDDDHLTRWTFHRVAKLQQFLDTPAAHRNLSVTISDHIISYQKFIVRPLLREPRP